MVWQMQSDRSGKVYEFEDDVSPEDALDYMDNVLEKQAEWKDVAKAIPPTAKAHAMKQQQGMANLIGAQPSIPAKIGGFLANKFLQPKVEEAEAEAQAAVPQNMSTVQKGALSAGSSIMGNAPGLLVGGGVAASGVAQGLARGPAMMQGLNTMLGQMAIAEGSAEFQEQLDDGASPGKAAVHGAAHGAAEYIGERLAFTPIAKLLGGSDTKLKKVVFDFLLRDQVGEQLTTTLQWINRKVSREPDLTLADLVEEMQVTAVSTAMAGPVQGAIATPIMRAAGGPEAAPERREPTIGGEAAVEPDVAPEGQAEQGSEGPGDGQASRGRLVLDSELPIIGEEPGNRESIGRELPLDQRLELLRQSWEDYNNKSFNDTAEDRIRKRSAFLERRAAIERELMFSPEGRALLRESDAQLGLQVPTLELELEQQVEEYATLGEEEILERRVAREQESRTVDTMPQPDPEVLLKLFITNQTEALLYPTSEFDAMRWSNDNVKASFAGRTVLAAGRPEYQGKTYEEIINLLQPDDIVYVGKAGQENINGAPWLMNMLRDLKETYLPDRAIVIGEVEAPNSGKGSYAAVLRDGVYGMPIPAIRPSVTSLAEPIPGVGEIQTRMRLDSESANGVDTLLHEFSHMLHFRHWQDSPTEEKASVAKQYYDELKAATEMSVKDASEMLFSAPIAKQLQQSWIQSGGKLTDKFVDPTSPMLPAVFNKPNYWFNFNEWIAHKGVKYFTTRAGVRKENVNFFKRFIESMAKFYKNFVSKYTDPGRSFAQWFDNIAARESGMKLALTEKEIKQVQQELVEAGLDPLVANMIASVKGRDSALIRELREKQRDFQAELRGRENEEKYFKKLQGLIDDPSYSTAKALAHSSTLAKDLLEMPVFAEDRFSGRMFADAVLSSSVNDRTVRVERAKGQSTLTRYTFTGKAGSVTVMLGAGVNVMENTYDSTAPVIGLINYALRDQAARHGRSLVVFSDPVLKNYYEFDLGFPGSHTEIPYYLFQAPIRPSKGDLATDMRIPAGVANMAQKLNLPWLNSYANSTARFNAFFSRALGAFQLIKLNEHIPGMVQEREALRNRMAYRHQWLAVANERVEEWAYSLPKTEVSKLGRLLFDEAENGKWLSTIHDDPNRRGHRIFRLDPQEVQRRKLSPEAVELYSKIRDDFMSFAEEWQKVGLWEIARNNLSDVTHYAMAEAMRNGATVKDVMQIAQVELGKMQNAIRAKQIRDQMDELNNEFENWKSSPYMPYTRFGRYGVLVRDGQDGKTKYFEGFDTARQARSAAEELKKSFGGDSVSTTYLEDVPYMLAGLPPSMLNAMKTQLNLTPTQEAEFSEILKRLSHANSFAHRSARKRGIPGYSKDALRAYSDYFRRGSAFLARTKSQPELDDAMHMLKRYINQQTATGGDTVKYGQLHEWFERLHKYLNDPGNDYGEVKSFMSLFHFGFNAATAMVNMTQVPFVTVPYLTERFETKNVLETMTKAYKDVIGAYKNPARLSAEEQALLDHARAEGFRDQSQATVLAQLADGSALARAQPVAAWQRGLNTFNHYAMWMFSKGELVNRDVTLIATYRLARKPGFSGQFDKNAYEQARQAVENTHNEYERENRPEFMRGAGSMVFQFMHFVQNMLFLQLGGDKSWWKLLLVQLGISGMLGLPFGEDATNAAKALGRIVFGKDWDLQREMRLYLDELGADPDLVLRGLLSDVWGFDLSRRVSLGEIVPGMRAVASHRKLNDVMYDAVGDAGGPAVSLMMNAFKFLSEDDKTSWTALKSVLPTGMKNLGSAAHAFVEGKVTDRSGATLYEPDIWGITGMSVGFVPEELSEAYQARSLQGEQAAYWTQRRGTLLHMWSDIVLKRDKDREATADFMKRLKEFNAEAPDPKLRISGETLRNSVRARVRANVLKESGMGSESSMQLPASDISRTFR